MKSAPWSHLEMRLPTKLYGHTSVLLDNAIIMHISGCNKDKNVSKSISTTNVLPDSHKINGRLAAWLMQEARCFHATDVIDKSFNIWRTKLHRSYKLSS